MGIKLSNSDPFSQAPQASLGGSNWECWAHEAGRQLSLGMPGVVPLVHGANPTQHLLPQLIPRKIKPHREPGLSLLTLPGI